jgi:nitrous oxidase accessory protein NosD
VVVGVVVVAMVLAGMPLLSQPAAAATLVVDDDGAQCPSAGYTTIQGAVDAAAAGDTIRVCDGTYNEAVNVGTAGLTIVADGTPVLDGGGSLGTAFSVGGVATDVTIRGMEVRNYKVNSIIVRGDRALIEDVSVDNGSRVGIVLNGASDSRIVNSETSNNPSGYRIFNSPNATVRGSVSSNDGTALRILNSPDSQFIDTVFRDSTANSFGVQVTDADNLELRNVTLENTGGFDGGYFITGSEGVQFIDSTVTNINGNGIRVDGGSVTVQNTTVSQTTQSGIFTRRDPRNGQSAALTVEDSTLSQIGQRGIYVFRSEGRPVRIRNNTFTDTAVGFYSRVAQNLQVTDNTVLSSRGGIAVDLSSTGALIENNLIRGITSGGTAVAIDRDSTGAVVRGNDIIENSGPGIRIGANDTLI